MSQSPKPRVLVVAPDWFNGGSAQKDKKSNTMKSIPRKLGRLGKMIGSPVAVATCAAILSQTSGYAAEVEVDLTAVPVDTLLTVPADFGGNGLVGNFHTQPAGTGVFEPFLTLEREASGGNPVGIERAYNTDGHTQMYLDQQRPEWNTLLRVSQLARIEIGGVQ